MQTKLYVTSRKKVYVVTWYLCDYETFSSPEIMCVTESKEGAWANARDTHVYELLREEGKVGDYDNDTVTETSNGFLHEFKNGDLVVEIAVHEEYLW